MPTPILTGPEWTLNNGQFIETKALANGTFITAVALVGGGTKLYTHTSDGQVKGSVILPTGGDANSVNAWAFTALKDGGFMAVTTELRAAGSGTEKHVFARAYNADGSARGPAFQVDNDVVSKDSHVDSVTTLANGNIAITYVNSDGPDASNGLGVTVRMFTAAGAPLGSSVRVNSTVDFNQFNSHSAALANGGLAVVYEDESVGGGSAAIRAKVITGSGQTAEITVATGPGDHRNAQVAGLADGRFVVTWEGRNEAGDGDGHGVYAQIFNANGTASGATFLVNTTKIDWQHQPAITALKNGGFAIAFTDESAPSTADEKDIRVQLFNADGSKDGAELLVNTTTAGWQKFPSITELADGRLVVGWSDSTTRDITYNTRYQIIDPRSKGVTLAGTALDDDLQGTAFNDTLNGDAGNDKINGGAGNDIIGGGIGNDNITSGLGNDQLRGDAGRDAFVFDTRPNKSTNVDKVYDFKSADDSFYLDNAIFTKLGRSGSIDHPVKIKAGMFYEGKKAHDRDDRIIYDKKTGSLYYDDDGSGRHAQVKIATLTNKTKLYYHDFLVI